MISALDERHVARGYDPYNSADQPHVLAAVNLKRAEERSMFKTDNAMRRGFKYLANHPQIAADILSYSIEFLRRNPNAKP